jgi:hypothetical protein
LDRPVSWFSLPYEESIEMPSGRTVDPEEAGGLVTGTEGEDATFVVRELVVRELEDVIRKLRAARG